MNELIVFYILSGLMIALAVMTVTARKTLRAAIYLLFVLIGTAGLYLLLNYHFLAAVQISVYAGGVVVLFIFAILLTNEKSDTRLILPPIRKIIGGAFTALAGIAIITFALWKVRHYVYADPANIVGDHEVDMKTIGHAMLGTGKHQYLLSFEVLSILLLACIIGGVLIARKR